MEEDIPFARTRSERQNGQKNLKETHAKSPTERLLPGSGVISVQPETSQQKVVQNHLLDPNLLLKPPAHRFFPDNESCGGATNKFDLSKVDLSARKAT